MMIVEEKEPPSLSLLHWSLGTNAAPPKPGAVGLATALPRNTKSCVKLGRSHGDFLSLLGFRRSSPSQAILSTTAEEQG